MGDKLRDFRILWGAPIAFAFAAIIQLAGQPSLDEYERWAFRLYAFALPVLTLFFLTAAAEPELLIWYNDDWLVKLATTIGFVPWLVGTILFLVTVDEGGAAGFMVGFLIATTAGAWLLDAIRRRRQALEDDLTG